MYTLTKFFYNNFSPSDNSNNDISHASLNVDASLDVVVDVDANFQIVITFVL